MGGAVKRGDGLAFVPISANRRCRGFEPLPPPPAWRVRRIRQGLNSPTWRSAPEPQRYRQAPASRENSPLRQFPGSAGVHPFGPDAKAGRTAKRRGRVCRDHPNSTGPERRQFAPPVHGAGKAGCGGPKSKPSPRLTATPIAPKTRPDRGLRIYWACGPVVTV